MSELMQYDEFVARHNAAFAAYREMHIAKNPLPIKPKVQGADVPIIAALVVMVIAAVIVSGSRTINEFGGGVIGFSAFAMLEVGIVAYAYIRTRKHYDAERHQSVQALTRRGMWMAFLVTLFANLHSTLKSNGIEIASIVDTLIFALIAISAPTLALISGDILGMEAVSIAHRRNKAEAEYQALMSAWNEGLNRGWDANKSRMGVRLEISKPVSPVSHASQLASHVSSHETRHEETLRKSAYGFQRTADGETQVMNWFKANPDDMSLPVRELETKIGVSKSTISRARRKWIDQQQSTTVIESEDE